MDSVPTGVYHFFFSYRGRTCKTKCPTMGVQQWCVEVVMINWYLHHGNKCRNTKTGAEFFLDYPYKAYDSHMLRDTCGDSYPQRDCLPVCRSLENMDSNTKKEFVRKFKVQMQHLTVDRYNVIHIDRQVQRECTVPEVLWLIERGFYIGQYEEGEYILEGRKDEGKSTGV